MISMTRTNTVSSPNAAATLSNCRIRLCDGCLSVFRDENFCQHLVEISSVHRAHDGREQVGIIRVPNRHPAECAAATQVVPFAQDVGALKAHVRVVVLRSLEQCTHDVLGTGSHGDPTSRTA